MAISPSSSSRLELTISVAGSSQSPSRRPSSGDQVVRDLDINEMPEEAEEDDSQWMRIGGLTAELDVEEDGNGGGGDGSTPRKKLRLTKEQSLLLEESFRANHTLNPKQKQELALQLELRPRQVEVWFQNRRARSKLKQTEMECEYLKRWLGSLTEQNRRLQREVEELRAMKMGAATAISPHTSQPLPASAFTMCPRCDRLAVAPTPHPL